MQSSLSPIPTKTKIQQSPKSKESFDDIIDALIEDDFPQEELDAQLAMMASKLDPIETSASYVEPTPEPKLSNQMNICDNPLNISQTS